MVAHLSTPVLAFTEPNGVASKKQLKNLDNYDKNLNGKGGEYGDFYFARSRYCIIHFKVRCQRRGCSCNQYADDSSS